MRGKVTAQGMCRRAMHGQQTLDRGVRGVDHGTFERLHPSTTGA